jgi:hypothetical protein
MKAKFGLVTSDQSGEGALGHTPIPLRLKDTRFRKSLLATTSKSINFVKTHGARLLRRGFQNRGIALIASNDAIECF